MTEDRAALQDLAGEFVLGLLDPDESAAFERRAEREPAAASAIAEWRERLLVLDAAAAPVLPSDDLWARIDDGLDAPGAEAPPAAPARKFSLLTRLWSDLPAWRGATLAGAAATLALAIFAAATYRDAQRQPQVIAVLLTPDGKPGAVIDVFADGSSYVAPLTDVSVPADRIMQVWTLADPAVGPVSLGLLAEDGSARLRPAALPAPKPRQLYEITLEPDGGSPTGKPTGPILFKGFAERPR
ncbi:anti-sigma factor [Chelatococcus sambhunathii]|uniref:Anti-sigma factor n=1 Tax=Chelatococcus sambhunathii TaxID=363953 RepID=A0ABU1DEJ9_9HYPH|nr:anti-sigma factor [Chelatococcus sambhunathii]MDR4306551.1 anti-sigma factor [Chelatococcus sambhunathii]